MLAGADQAAGESWFQQEGLADGSDWLPEATLDAFPGMLRPCVVCVMQYCCHLKMCSAGSAGSQMHLQVMGCTRCQAANL